jgi:hypothetical protein
MAKLQASIRRMYLVSSVAVPLVQLAPGQPLFG